MKPVPNIHGRRKIMRCLMKIATTAAPILLALAGCSQWRPISSPESSAGAARQPNAPYLGKGVVQGEGGQDGAVGTALAMSQKNAQLTEELLKAQEARHELEEMNRKLTAQVAALQGESQSAKKELADADEMLREMRADLDQWKANVLGFRDEMRQAEQAQAEALRKVLVLLGAEAPPAAVAATRPAATTQPALTAAHRSAPFELDSHK
jgi:hypothetical protein